MENEEQSTVELDSLKYDFSTSYGMNAKGSVTLGTYNASGLNYSNVTVSNGAYQYSGSPMIYTTNNTGNSLHVSGNADFEGDVKIKGHSLLHLMEKMEERLAILQEPDPAKLEKYAALKKAYDHYKLMEKLIGED
mgnify:FL=1